MGSGEYRGSCCSIIGQNSVDIHFEDVNMSSSRKRTASVEDEIKYSSVTCCHFCDVFNVFAKAQSSADGNSEVLDAVGPRYRSTINS